LGGDDAAAPLTFALRRVFGPVCDSPSSIQTGAWSLAFSQPRTLRSTSAAFSRTATEGLIRK